MRLAAGPLLLLGLTAWGAYPLASPDIRDVRLTDGFWFDRLETNRLVTLKTDLARCEETVRLGDRTFPRRGASNGLKLVPYCIWGNREPGNEMQVWLKEKDRKEGRR